MSIENIRQFIREKAEQFGAKTDNEFNKPYIERNNTGQDALKDNGAYFGFIHPEEESSGPFHDFSLTIFPNDQAIYMKLMKMFAGIAVALYLNKVATRKDNLKTIKL